MRQGEKKGAYLLLMRLLMYAAVTAEIQGFSHLLNPYIAILTELSPGI